MATAMELHGGARHIGYISDADLLYISKFQIINQVPAALSATLGKISVALFIMRISGRTSKWRRWFLIVHITLYTLVTIINLCVLLGQCRPIQALWNQSLKTTGQAKCLDPKIDTDITMLQSCKTYLPASALITANPLLYVLLSPWRIPRLCLSHSSLDLHCRAQGRIAEAYHIMPHPQPGYHVSHTYISHTVTDPRLTDPHVFF